MISLASADDVPIAGATLAVWRERMNLLDPADPQSRQWTPGLIAIVQTESAPWFTRRQAALTLGRMREHARDAVPVLRTLLDDVGEDPETGPQLWALKALALFGPTAKDATPDIVRLLRSPTASELARLSAVEALSQIGGAHAAAVPTLIDFAGDDQQPVLRRAGIEALGAVGPAATSALPVLIRALDDADENLRREAAVSLGRLGPQADSAAEALLVRLVFDEIPAVQDAAATALTSIGPAVGPQVVPLLESEDGETRRHTLTILGGWGPRGRTWQREVEARWSDPVASVRLAALDAGWQIARNGPVIAPRVAAELTVEDRQHRIAAVRLLARMGAAAQPAVPTLQRLSQHARPEVRLAAQKALAALEVTSP